MADWKIGDVEITKLVELELTGGTRFILPEALRDVVKPIGWLRPHFADAEGNLIMAIQSFLVTVGDLRLVVDTCIGNDKERDIPPWNMLDGPYLRDLGDRGFAPDTVDLVLCTHLHVDHVGWNTKLEDGHWVPTFPNARYLFGRQEWSYWDQATGEGFQGGVIEDSVRPIVDAGKAELVDTDHRICDEIQLVPTPGHTPGHVSVKIESRGEQALITGDFLHHPCQMARPEWASSADFDQDQAIATRKRMFEELADGPVLVIGTHFAGPTAGKLVRDGDAYRLDV